MGGKRPPIGCAEWSHARFGPGLYFVFRPFGLARLSAIWGVRVQKGNILAPRALQELWFFLLLT